MAKKFFIKEAIKHPGALTAKAKSAGMTVPEFCASREHTGTTARQCNLAKTLRGMSKKR